MNYTENSDGSLTREDGVVIPASERSRCEIYSRVVGFLRPIENWNDGKKEEFKNRKTYVVQ